MQAIINLTEGYNPVEEITSLKYEYMVFPGGEPHIKLHGFGGITELFISIKIKCFNDLGKLLCCVNAVRTNFSRVNIHLLLGYFPGARQDRYVPNEEFGVKMYADIINSLGLSSVTIFDPHSDVTPALINKCRIRSNTYFITQALVDIKKDTGEYPILIAPDAGSSKKIDVLLSEICRVMPYYKHRSYYQGFKHRDVKTGKLSGFNITMNSIMDTHPLLIVDDICDGGGTFIGLAEVIKKLNTDAKGLYLAVSHGIFSKGIEELTDTFNKVYSTDTFCDASLGKNHVIFQQQL